MWREAGQEAGRLNESEFKICDLCGALNLARNQACFICSWRGRFETRPDVIRMAIELTERRYGGLAPEMLADTSARPVAGSTSARGRFHAWLDSLKRWLLG